MQIEAAALDIGVEGPSLLHHVSEALILLGSGDATSAPGTPSAGTPIPTTNASTFIIPGGSNNTATTQAIEADVSLILTDLGWAHGRRVFTVPNNPALRVDLGDPEARVGFEFDGASRFVEELTGPGR